MTEKAIAIVRIKAKILKDHIGQMKTMLTADVIDKPNLFLRLADLSTSFHKYEETYENLIIVDKT